MTNGQKAYEAFADALGAVDEPGPWAKVPPRVRAAWEVAARAVLAEVGPEARAAGATGKDGAK